MSDTCNTFGSGLARGRHGSPFWIRIPFEYLSLRTPETVQLTPVAALQNKIERKLEKSLGNQFNIQLKQEMGIFQASMLEAMKSPREEMQSMKKASEAVVDQASASISKAGPSKQNDPIIHPITWMLNL